MPRSAPRAAAGIPARKLQSPCFKTTMNSRNILLVSYYLCALRSRHRESAAGAGPLLWGHRKGAGHGPHRPDHHRRRAHGARGAGYPGELPVPMPAAGPDRAAPGYPGVTSSAPSPPAMPGPPTSPARHWQSPTITRHHCPADPPRTSPSPRTPAAGMAMPPAAALPRPVAPRRRSRQIARTRIRADRPDQHAQRAHSP
jgi:hypothetical protein